MKKVSAVTRIGKAYSSNPDFLLGGYSNIIAAVMLITASNYYLKGIEYIAFKNGLSISGMLTLWLIHISSISLTATDLTHFLVIEPHTVSRMLSRLEKQKLIKRKQSKDDRRNRDVSLTVKGKDLIENVFPEVGQLARFVFTETLSKKELDSLIILTRKVRDTCYKRLEGDTHDFEDNEAVLAKTLKARELS